MENKSIWLAGSCSAVSGKGVLGSLSPSGVWGAAGPVPACVRMSPSPPVSLESGRSAAIGQQRQENEGCIRAGRLEGLGLEGLANYKGLTLSVLDLVPVQEFSNLDDATLQCSPRLRFRCGDARGHVLHPRDGAGFIRAFPWQQDLGSLGRSVVLWCGFSDV